jgi:tRNA-splicing ligase RtcB
MASSLGRFQGMINKVSEAVWEIPTSYKAGMRVKAVVYADDDLLSKMTQDATLEQATNVTALPGIQKFSITLPDGHEGYGFPIGGVAATDFASGVVSPGGVGYDINCGVRLLTTNLEEKDVRPRLSDLLKALFENVPSGLGSSGKLRLNAQELDRAVVEGVEWAIKKGYGRPEDAKHCEENGTMPNADPSKVSPTAKSRGSPQLGSLGSGNHFLEIDLVDKILDEPAARAYGITHPGQVVVFVHTGSRGYGHQICSDYLQVMEHATRKYNINLPDRELACSPVESAEARDYFAAMACAVNYAFLNRQLVAHWVRESFERVYRTSSDKLGMEMLYDVCHNIAKIEEHIIDGQRKSVVVHRKGATRAFPPGSALIPQDYREIGQPVLIPGSMGSSSWILKGTQEAMSLSFGSTAHGAGRFMSRTAAIKKFWGSEVKKKLEDRGILVRAANIKVISEEAPGAYKDCDAVAEVSHRVGLAKKVARLVPIGVTKG